MSRAEDSGDIKLRKLDSIAFHALETNNALTTERAQDLLRYSELKKSHLHQINAYTILGIVNKNKGYYVTALHHYLKALDISETLNDQGRKSACLNNIGTIYLLQENYLEALKYFNKSLKIEESNSQALQKSIRYYNIGDVYNYMDSLDLALNFYTNSLLIEKKYKNAEGIIYAKLGITEIYLKSQRNIDARHTLSEVESLIGKHNLEEKIIFLRLSALLNIAEKKYAVATDNISDALKLAKDNSLRTRMAELLKLKIQILENRKNWMLVAETYKELEALNNELNNIKVKNQLADLSFQNELKRKEMEIKLMTNERNLAKKNERFEQNVSSYSQRIIWFLLLSCIVGLILIFRILKGIYSK